jgi:SAM-dependent methyltransferase
MPYEVELDPFQRRRFEYAYALSNVKPYKVLDVGIENGYLDVALLGCGLEVHGVDINDFPKPDWLMKNPKFKFVLGDINEIYLAESYYDTVMAICTLEHLGMRAYGVTKLDPEADVKAARRMAFACKPDGRIIITVPYGLGGRDWWRSYNKESLARLLEPFHIDEIRFFSSVKLAWITQEEAEKVQHGFYQGREISSTELCCAFVLGRPKK